MRNEGKSIMKTVALCMIVKNEEDFLRRCLDSVVDKVDQIVIVDTGSTDDTVSIAKEYTNEVYHFDWIDDFSIARNESLKYAKTDYILVLDADEYIEGPIDILEGIDTDADYYFTKIHNIMTQDRAINHLAIRLFANNRGLHYCNRLHEHLNTYEDKDRFKASFSNFTIMHTGYTDEMLNVRQKSQRNLSLMLKEVKENPSVYNLFNMGRTYNWIGDHEQAIEYLKQAYPLSKELTILPELIATLCRSLGELRRYNEALSILQEAVKVLPSEVDLIHLQAVYFKEIGYHRDAIAGMERCLEIGDQGITFTEGNGTYIAHFRLAEWYMIRNEYKKAYDNIVEAVKFKNNFVPIIGKYFEIIDRLNLPSEDVFSSTNYLFKVQNSDQLKNILEVLYHLRHPLIKKYLETYQVTVQDNVKAVSYQFNKEYEIAKDIWINVAEYDNENSFDMLMLSYILKNTELFEKGFSRLNLSYKEIKSLKTILLNQTDDKLYLTKNLEDILFIILMHLMRLHEFELFEELLKVLLQGSMDINVQICERLIRYGYDKLSIDLLLNLHERYPRNIEILKLLGDLCKNSQYYEDAKTFYIKLIEYSDEYSSYERLYDLYELTSDDEKTIFKQEISRKFILCLWAGDISLGLVTERMVENIEKQQNLNYLRLNKKKELLDLVCSIDEGLDYVKIAEEEQAKEMLDNCNYCLNLISNHLSNEQQIKEKLQSMMLGLLFIKPRLIEIDLVDQKISEMKLTISQIKKMINEEIKTKLEIVFMPYKASMWDSFDSIYAEAINDPECEVHVVPIPFYEKNAEGQIIKFCYEGNDLPDNISTTPYEIYNFEERKPDIIYIHNPFDGHNTLTMVNPRFFSENLSNYTNMLVYVPYYVAGSSQNPQVNLPLACNHVNKIVVQSSTLREAYINSGIEDTKILDLGSPKIDASLKLFIPKNSYLNLWKETQSQRKVFLFNTGIADLLSTNTWYGQIEETINYFLENPQFSLIWRPHPLTGVTLNTMRPNIKTSYEEIEKKIDSSPNIFVDNSSDAYPAIHVSDAIISDYSSILLQYIATGKPVLGLLNSEVLGKDRFYFADYLGCYFTGEGETISQYVQMVDSNQDFKKEERIERFLRSITNSDGTSGQKIHISIKRDLLSVEHIYLEEGVTDVLCKS